jgi:glutamate N-acetyltransferase / amino-acid N-acetyltransferase
VSVTAPAGFRASGVVAGLKESGRPDLGLLVADGGASAAGLFTTNAFPAAPVTVSQRHLLRGRARAVVVNSGQANAATGEKGIQDAEFTCAAVAGAIGPANAEDVLVCSTGVIGPRVKLANLTAALPEAAGELSPDGGTRFAEAILTTDTVCKETVVHSDGFTVGGCVKGVGMIAPRLATMLAFLTTDAEVEPAILDAALRRAVAPVFNGLTVDDCPSTNDTVLLLASGASGFRADPGTPQVAALEAALAEAARDLVHQIQLDAEGATKAIAVQVSGGLGEDAAKVAREVASSMLVKAAVFGGDPNPGRILQAVGASGIPIIPERVSIDLAGHRVVTGGVMVAFDEVACAEALKERDLAIEVDLGLGDVQATAFGCDLGYEYVRINAEYTT